MDSHIVTSIWLTVLFLAYQVFATHGLPAISTHRRNGVRRLAESIDRSGYINIDCGASAPHQTLGGSYDTDEKYIATGTNMEVDQTSGVSDFNLRTLRSFPMGEKNCYTLKLIYGRNWTYLIRASFTYGNYDRINKTPVFDIYIGVNYCTTISDSVYFIEITYKPTSDWIYFCLVNTGAGTPFISELVLRPLNDSLYNVSEFESFFLWQRYTAGSYSGSTDVNYEQYRSYYAEDVYDRQWACLPPDSLQNSINYTENTDLSSLKNDEYRVPPSIFKTGAKARVGSRSMNYFYSPNSGIEETYFYFHFAEIQKIMKNESREFNIFIDGKPISEEPIKLQYLDAVTVASSSTKLLSGNSSIWISIDQTNTSTLPPILNAIEVYAVTKLPQSATNQDDTSAIMDIKTNYSTNGLMKSWQGDPCLPLSPWDGLICSGNGNDSPTITSLNLASQGLKGEILPSFFSLKSLKSLNLSNNNLIGSIPEFLADMPSLQDLDLSGNNLGGSIPIKLIDKVKNGRLSFRFEGNPNCSSDTCRKPGKKHKFLIPVLVASALCILLIAVTSVAVWKCKWKRKAGFSNRFKTGGVNTKNRKFTYSEVINMTNNFERVIGRGGFGSVYHGSLNDGTEVAVKVLNSSSNFSIHSFHIEAELLMRVHHKHLVSLVGYCEEETTMALIYEYMANGNLQQCLYRKDGNVLSWKARLQIITDTAQGLDYLHNGCKPAIVHRDMKPANILLDDRMRAKIADFGLSRMFSSESKSHISTQNVAGTLGYLDPEYGSAFRLTEKSDVYSFGIILLQIITGEAVVTTKDEEIVHIVDWVNPLLSRGDISTIVDKHLQGEFSTNSAWTALEVAMSCVSPTGNQRPNMTQVWANLKDCLAVELDDHTARHGVNRQLTTAGPSFLEVGSVVAVDSEAITGPQPR